MRQRPGRWSRSHQTRGPASRNRSETKIRLRWPKAVRTRTIPRGPRLTNQANRPDKTLGTKANWKNGGQVGTGAPPGPERKGKPCGKSGGLRSGPVGDRQRGSGPRLPETRFERTGKKKRRDTAEDEGIREIEGRPVPSAYVKIEKIRDRAVTQPVDDVAKRAT